VTAATRPDPSPEPAERGPFGLPRWQANQYVVGFLVLVSFLAFDASTPFFPLFIRELGDMPPSEAALWAGLLTGIAPFLSGLSGPFWARIADRVGRPLMVGRSLVAMTVALTLMAFATQVWHLFALRGALGLIGGYVPMVMALALAGAPRERTGQIVGSIQFMQFSSVALGPIVGGVLADRFGLRANFAVAAVLVALALVILVVAYREPRSVVAARAARSAPRLSMREVLRLPGLGAAMAVLFLAQYVDRAFLPTLPLYVTTLDVPADAVALIAGLGIGAGGLGVALSGWIYGRLSATVPIRRLLTVSLAGGAVVAPTLVLVDGVYAFIALRTGLALVAGGAIGLAYTTAARAAPAEQSATVLSVLGTVGSAANAIGPPLSGALATQSLPLVYLLNAPILLLALAIVRLRWRAAAPGV
jgi:MFS transporter, DHA1 family, multidrug resistance protein